jgi:hypothetical protein
MWYTILNVSIVFVIGALFGFGEIVQRYADIKYYRQLIVSWIYIGLNGLIAILALFLIKSFRYPNDYLLDFHNDIEIANLLIAGLSGMAVLRSSLFSIKHKGETVEVGLATICQTFLSWTEKRMNNKAAELRFKSIEKIMKDVDFSSAIQGVPLLCTSFIDDFPEEDFEVLFKEINIIISMDTGGDDTLKSILLGRQIAKYCDEGILTATVSRYRQSKVEKEISSKKQKLMNKKI